jgi:Ser/Thr protein kinase RdoA (MazF antagonist)
MDRIPPKERFTRHAKISELPPAVLIEAIDRFGISQNDCHVLPLAGGFMNANFLVASGDNKFVFRVYSTDRVTAERERDVLQFLSSCPVNVPQTLALFETQGRPVAVLEYIDGTTLEDKLLTDTFMDLRIFEETGRQLGHIHTFQFNETGFIGPKMIIGKEYDNFGHFILQFIEKTLSELQEERLNRETKERMRSLVQDRWHLVLETEPRRQLVHTDFNPKNILVSNGPNARVSAILDWEFCVSGNGLVDLGNFFRFAYDYPAEAHKHFEKGYRSVNSQLPLEWADAARLLDLGNMCSFLERREDYQESFRTARAVIHSTLDHFGY